MRNLDGVIPIGVMALTDDSDFLLNIMRNLSEIGKAMAKCYCSKVTTEVDGWKFEFAEESNSVRNIKMYKDGEFIAKTSEVVAANTILHREKLEKNCEEKFGWVMLKKWASESELKGAELYDYLSAKCVEEGITLDILDKHSDDILKKV